jgi:hypothetical protein
MYTELLVLRKAESVSTDRSTICFSRTLLYGVEGITFMVAVKKETQTAHILKPEQKREAKRKLRKILNSIIHIHFPEPKDKDSLTHRYLSE